jgi:hypothetical protein
MSAIISSAARMARASATPLRAVAARHYSATATESSAPALHSTKKLAIASGVAFVAGIDVTYA